MLKSPLGVQAQNIEDEEGKLSIFRQLKFCFSTGSILLVGNFFYLQKY